MTPSRIKQCFIAIAALCMLSIGSAALAQYVWLDEKGNKQYSDMPPPTSIPAKSILKMPGKFSVPSADVSSSNAQSNDAQNNDKSPPTLADQNAAYKKRQDDQAAKEKKAADNARDAASKARNCDTARAYQRTLDSGQRIAQMDKNGQRAYFDDSQRDQASRDNKRVLEECK